MHHELCTTRGCMLESLSLQLRGVHVTPHTSLLDMTLQGPGPSGLRLAADELHHPSTRSPPLPPHTPPPAPLSTLWTATKYPGALIREGNRTSTSVRHAKKDYFWSRRAQCGLSEILLLLLPLLLLLSSPAEEPIKGGPPRHSKVRHHPSFSLPSIHFTQSPGRCCRRRYWFVSFVSLSCLVSFISTEHSSACCFPFSKPHLLSASAHGCEAVLRRRLLLSRRLPHSFSFAGDWRYHLVPVKGSAGAGTRLWPAATSKSSLEFFCWISPSASPPSEQWHFSSSNWRLQTEGYQCCGFPPWPFSVDTTLPSWMKRLEEKTVPFERSTVGTPTSCASQLCPSTLTAIHTGSAPCRHSESSFKDINTRGNETQRNGPRDWRT